MCSMSNLGNDEGGILKVQCVRLEIAINKIPFISLFVMATRSMNVKNPFYTLRLYRQFRATV